MKKTTKSIKKRKSTLKRNSKRGQRAKDTAKKKSLRQVEFKNKKEKIKKRWEQQLSDLKGETT